MIRKTKLNKAGKEGFASGNNKLVKKGRIG
jgi:hypothetical protein